jgi:hypothetical protein
MAKILSGKIKKVPSALVSADRYNFLGLSEAEPDAGIPSANNGLFASDTNGNRKWLQTGSGLSIDESGNIVVDETTLPINTAELSYSNSDTLSGVLSDLDEVLLGVEGLVATFIAEVKTDESLTGDGTEESPLSVFFGNINIQKRDESFLLVKLTAFLSNCLRIDSETQRENYAKVYTRNDESINILI